MNARAAWIGLALVAAFAVGVVVERWTSAAEQAVAGERALTTELTQIREILEKIAGQAEGAGGLAGVPEPLLEAPVRLVEGMLESMGGGAGSTSDPAVDEALRALHAQVAEEGRRTREALQAIGVTSLGQLRDLRPNPDPAALSLFAQQYAQSERAAVRSAKLMTVGDLVSKFGMPDEAWATDSGFNFEYHKPGTERETWVWVQIAHGLVAQITCHTE